MLCGGFGRGESWLGDHDFHTAGQDDGFVADLIEFVDVAHLVGADTISVLLLLRAVVEGPEERLQVIAASQDGLLRLAADFVKIVDPGTRLVSV